MFLTLETLGYYLGLENLLLKQDHMQLIQLRKMGNLTSENIISKIRTLEKKNIGRPSTYASIVDKLYTRNYVVKKDVKGIEKTFPILTMENGEEITIETTNETKVFQNEKNKMVMEELGINVIQLCTTHFSDLFNYEFTAKMEGLLDDVANDKTSYKKSYHNTWKTDEYFKPRKNR